MVALLEAPQAHPPALETAAASSGPDAWFIPARMMGCLMPSSFVMGVWIVWCAIAWPCAVASVQLVGCGRKLQDLGGGNDRDSD